MRKISEKLRDQSGASILLALLFFLVCAMVGASVLMAAASNAGKSRGSRQEQQKYLTLSSALQLVRDELTAAKYTARYTVTTTYHVDEWSKPNENGEQYAVKWHYEHKYAPIAGIFECELSKVPNQVLPMSVDLDRIFAYSFLKETNVTDGDHRHYYKKPDSTLSLASYALTLEVATDDDTWLTEPVEVTIKLGDGSAPYGISLTAQLENDQAYTMYATLILNGADPRVTASAATTEGTVTESCAAVGWKLSQITREEAK